TTYRAVDHAPVAAPSSPARSSLCPLTSTRVAPATCIHRPPALAPVRHLARPIDTPEHDSAHQSAIESIHRRKGRADGAGRRWGGSSRGAGALTVRSAGLGLPPGEQFAAGLLLAEWSSFHPQCQQMLIGLAHLLTGRDAEDLHD